MFAEVYSTSVGGEGRISGKYITKRMSKDEVRAIVPNLIDNIRKGNKVVNLYLYEETKQKKYHNNYCRVQWAHKDAKYVPSISEDEIINGDIYIKWEELHDEFKKIIEREEK